MSLVLRGEWHMPKKCKNCLLCKPYETRASMGSRICIVTGKRLIYGETPSNPKGAGRFCPLVELPEKHGRLVDADAFAEHLRETVKSVEAFAPQMAMALEAAVRDLEDPKKTPTIVETESEEDENEKTD